MTTRQARRSESTRLPHLRSLRSVGTSGVVGTTLGAGTRTDHVVLTNIGTAPLRSPITIAVALPPGVSLASADGVTAAVPMHFMPSFKTLLLPLPGRRTAHASFRCLAVRWR